MSLETTNVSFYHPAMVLAYDYAAEVLRGEFQSTNSGEVAAVAWAYALEHWPTWSTDAPSIAQNPRQEQQQFIRLASTYGRYRRCQGHQGATPQ